MYNDLILYIGAGFFFVVGCLVVVVVVVFIKCILIESQFKIKTCQCKVLTRIHRLGKLDLLLSKRFSVLYCLSRVLPKCS